jgi:hypothetical protein
MIVIDAVLTFEAILSSAARKSLSRSGASDAAFLKTSSTPWPPGTATVDCVPKCVEVPPEKLFAGAGCAYRL